MGFETPALLALGALIALPLLAHMRRRSAAREVPFAANEIARIVAPVVTKPNPPQDRWLLALRVLLVLLIALAAANPTCARQGAVERADALALVLDDSGSMRAPTASPRFEQARAALLATLARAQSNAIVSLVRSSEPASVLVTRDASRVREALQRAVVTSSRGDVQLAAQQALATVRSEGARTPLLVVATDGTRSASPSSAGLAALGRLVRDAHAQLSLPLQPTRLTFNAGIADATLTRDADGWGIDASVRCYGAAPPRVHLRLLVGTTVRVEREASCNNEGAGITRLALSSLPETAEGTLQLVERDDFAADNERVVRLRPPPGAQVLVLGTSPSRGASSLAEALRATSDAAHVREVRPAGLPTALNERAPDLLVLVAVDDASLQDSAREALQQQLTRGTPLLVLSDDGQLPSVIATALSLSLRGHEDPMQAGPLDTTHPALTPLAPDARGLLPVTAARWSEVLATGPSQRVVWRTTVGAHALLVLREGVQRAAVLGVPLDEARGTLAVRPAWVALASSLRDWLSEPFMPRVTSQGVGAWRVVVRPGERIESYRSAQGVSLPFDARTQRVEGVHEPGVYRAVGVHDADGARSLFVALDGAESDLREATRPDDLTDASAGSQKASLRLYLVVAALLLLTAESLLRRRRSA